MNTNSSCRNSNTYRKAGHLADQQLKCFYPKSNQLSIFESLSAPTKGRIETRNIEKDMIVQGIQLSATETKIVDTLCKMLHEKSDNITAPTKENYYTGQKSADVDFAYTEQGKEQIEKTPAPRLFFTAYEFAKEYTAKQNPSGKDIENTRKLLINLSEKSFLMIYKETHWRKDGSRVEKEIELFERLISVPVLRETEYTSNNRESAKNETTGIFLHPIFQRQIDSKFLIYPSDITRRTQIANRSNRIAKATLILRDYLVREISYNRFVCEMNVDKLLFMVSGKEINNRNRKRADKQLQKAIQVCKDLNLLLKAEIDSNIHEKPKYIFHLNGSWS